MKQIHDFLSEVDRKWKPLGGEPVLLRIIGSAALMLQTDFERGTKDGDILEADEITSTVKAQLLALAGPKTDLHDKYRMYIDVVLKAILFWPQGPVFHPVPLQLKNFTVEVLDVTDVVVSKLKPFRQSDIDDIKAMSVRKLLEHKRLINRFESAVDRFSADARAEDLPRFIKNLNSIERDILGVSESVIDLPDWMQ